jgi:hypothetical protein
MKMEPLPHHRQADLAVLRNTARKLGVKIPKPKKSK